MKIRFQADADLNKAIVTGVLRREPSIDFQTSMAARLRGLKDSEVLALSAEQKRVLISHDVGTMPAHFQSFTAPGKYSPGVFLIPQSLELGRAIEELVIVWLASDPSDWEGRLVWFPI